MPAAARAPQFGPTAGINPIQTAMDPDVAVRPVWTFYVQTPVTKSARRRLPMLFHHFTEQESRAWIDAFIALVRLPQAQPDWG
jgi:hypothetical protein